MMRIKYSCLLFGIAVINVANAQQSVGTNDLIGGDEVNTITTAVPFLTIAPDARAGALGDAGVATSPDANSAHWNPAKLAFIEGDMGFSMSYSPWLRNLVNDIYLGYLTGYKRLNDRSTFGFSLLYFSLGDITFTNQEGENIGQFKPNEFAIDGSFATKLSDRISGGISAGYINSSLTNGINVQGQDTKAGSSFAVDLSGYYQNEDMTIFDRDATLGLGLNISNIGSKMSYSESAQRDFIPTNLRLGQALKIQLDEYNSITVITDINKLLVPSPPVYERDESGTIVVDDNNQPIIAAGRDPNVGVASGMFGSFSDAPGGFSEEIHELSYSLGMEYWYNDMASFRLGHFNEHKTKGNRKYYTIGAGFKLSVFSIDMAYLIATQQRSPLANTLRFTLLFDFDAFTSQNVEE